MKRRSEIPFESIENAHQYIKLLTETVAETKRDINDEITLAASQMSNRRVQALRMVEYNLEKLERYLSGSCRALNDLRSLRRLLLEERPAADATKSHPTAKTLPSTTTLPASKPLFVDETPRGHNQLPG